MSTGIYETQKKSRFFLYFVVITAFTLGLAFYAYTRPLAVESECSEIALKTSGITKSFNYDPIGDYEQTKTNCISETLETK